MRTPKPIILLLLACLLLPFTARAVNDVTLDGIVGFQFNTIDASPVLVTIYGQNGGVATNLDVESNYMDVTLDNGSAITFNSTGSYYFKLPNPLPAGVTATPACLLNQISLSSTANGVVTLQLTSARPACAPNQGGTTINPPINYLVKINNNASCADSSNVTLNLQAENASQVIISNQSNLADASWQAFTSPQNLNWTLTSGDGVKSVYVMYRSSSGSITSIITTTIELKSSGCVPATPTPTPAPTPTPTPTPIPTPTPTPATCLDGLSTGTLIKNSATTVYYYGADCRRHAFPNEKTYFTWYKDFLNIQKISADDLASIPLGENVTYKPGVKMLKVQTLPNVYAVDAHGTLRWVENEEAAEELYGVNWTRLVDDLSDAFYINYRTGSSIKGLADFNPVAVSQAATSINVDKGWVY